MKTDFEKLVVARKYVTALERENKLLKKEVVAQFKAVKAIEKVLKTERDFREKMSPSEKRQIKSDLYVQQLEDTIDDLKARLEAAIKANNEMVSQLIRMKAEEGQTDGHRTHQSLMTKLKRFFQKIKAC